jgi:hypothetical protein
MSELNPIRVSVHWDPELTCGTCVYWEMVFSGGQNRRFCCRPLVKGNKTIYPYRGRREIPSYTRACMAHKEK